MVPFFRGGQNRFCPWKAERERGTRAERSAAWARNLNDATLVCRRLSQNI